MWILENYSDNDSIILSVGEEEEKSIEYIARLIATEFDYEDNIIFDINFSDGQYKKTADNTKLKNIFPDFQFTPFEQGIKESIKWFIKNYPDCRL